MLTSVIEALKLRVGRASFNWSCSAVLQLPPLTLRQGNVTLISQVSGRDLTLYMFALRSLYPYLPGAQVVVVDDGTLGDDGRRMLARSVPGIELIGISSIATGSFPRGGTWERLVAILSRCAGSYVIQMDSDTMCLAEPVEVLAAIEQNRPFLLGTRTGQGIWSAAEASDFARKMTSSHIQPTAERLLETLDGGDSTRYVRACSAFAGFPKGFDGLSQAESFNSEMVQRLGKRWEEWGTEQVTSNFLLSNAPGSFVLPFPKYASSEPGLDLGGSSLIHFMGTWRWNRGHYRRTAASMLAEWMKQTS